MSKQVAVLKGWRWGVWRAPRLREGEEASRAGSWQEIEPGLQPAGWPEWATSQEWKDGGGGLGTLSPAPRHLNLQALVPRPPASTQGSQRGTCGCHPLTLGHLSRGAPESPVARNSVGASFDQSRGHTGGG